MSVARAITIGVFDGVHLGHAELVRQARAAVGDGRVTALCFEPHPLRVLRPGLAPRQLSSFEQRRLWLTEAGADEVVALAPTRELLGLSPESFLEGLMAEHAPDVIVEGPDFRFGRNRAGSVQTLAALETLGYRSVIVDDVLATISDQSSVRVTSSLIRWLVRHGRVRDSALLLGRPYELIGTVVAGDGRGADELGVATANLDCGSYLLPADGIYSGAAVRDDGHAYPAAVSIGTKPTFGENPRVCEAHLIGYEGDFDDYGWTIRLEIHDWLRDQISYSRVSLLIEQIHRDIERVRQASGIRIRQKVASPMSGASIRAQ